VTGIDGLVIGTGDPLPTQLSGVTVKVGGEAAPLLALANLPDGREQINFQVPFDRGPGGSGAYAPVVEIDFNGTATFMGFLPVAPGIFTLGDGSGAIQHGADYSLVTQANPVVPGEVLIIYATGFGQVDPAGQTGVPFASAGQLRGVGPFVVVTVGNTNCNVLYVGATPGFVGLYQINCQTSSTVSSGQQPLQMVFLFNPILGFPPPAYATNSNTVMLPVR
jgi:uncharacterized protein (TIGR03437 family)